MTPYQKRLNPYIQRMADDMRLRNYAQSTIDAYTHHVSRFCQHFGKPAEQLGPEQIREFQLYLVKEKKASWSSFNQAVCGLRFLYQITMGRNWTVKHIPFGKKPKKIPPVLGDREVQELLACVKNPKHRTVLLVCYAAGLRLSEATHLRIADIDGVRMQIHITNGKGRKERLVPIAPRLLGELRDYWKKYRPSNYLFPGKTPDIPLSSTTIQKACKLAVIKAKILKAVTPHTLRHSYATGLLEAGVDLLTIGRLLGHKSFTTTLIYLHVRRPHLDRAPSPVDWLPIRQCPKWVQPEGPPENKAPDNKNAETQTPQPPEQQPPEQQSPRKRPPRDCE